MLYSCCNLFPLISNGFQSHSANPCDMECNMLKVEGQMLCHQQPDLISGIDTMNSEICHPSLAIEAQPTFGYAGLDCRPTFS